MARSSTPASARWPPPGADWLGGRRRSTALDAGIGRLGSTSERDAARLPLAGLALACVAGGIACGPVRGDDLVAPLTAAAPALGVWSAARRARAAGGGRAAAVEFSVLSYNTHGLPGWIAGDAPERRFPSIGALVRALRRGAPAGGLRHHLELARRGAGPRRGARQPEPLPRLARSACVALRGLGAHASRRALPARLARRPREPRLRRLLRLARAAPTTASRRRASSTRACCSAASSRCTS